MLKWLIIVAALLTISACSGETSSDTPNAVQTENPEDFGELSNAIAQDFINYVGDDREIIAVINPTFKFKPKPQCFDYWHKKGDFIPTPETINKCQLWVKELAWLYGTYGYNVGADAFKSKLFWEHLDSFDVDAARKTARKNKSDWTCPSPPQVGYDTPQLIPLSQKNRSCPDFVKGD